MMSELAIKLLSNIFVFGICISSAQISEIITIFTVQRVFGDKCNQRTLNSVYNGIFYHTDISLFYRQFNVYSSDYNRVATGKLWRPKHAVFSFIIYKLLKRDKAMIKYYTVALVVALFLLFILCWKNKHVFARKAFQSSRFQSC